MIPTVPLVEIWVIWTGESTYRAMAMSLRTMTSSAIEGTASRPEKSDA
jgi:hypothetical protein